MSFLEGLLAKRNPTVPQSQAVRPPVLPADEGLASLLLAEDQDKIVPQFRAQQPRQAGIAPNGYWR